jgi:hypothetical protein
MEIPGEVRVLPELTRGTIEGGGSGGTLADDREWELVSPREERYGAEVR